MIAVLLALLSASLAQAADPLPPAVLYHYGHQGHLLEDAALDTVPESAWYCCVMGLSTSFGLKPFRRGLYGVSHPAYASFFGDQYVSRADKTPWLMAIHLDPACRAQGAVAGIRSLPTNPAFRRWLAEARGAEFATVEDYARTCVPPGSLQFTAGSLPETDCERTVARFLDEGGIRVVVDDAWEKSWYVRDRSCITRIDGSAEEVLRMMTMPGFWNLRQPDGNERAGNPKRGQSLLIILLEALKRADPEQVTDGTLGALSSLIAASSFPVTWGGERREYQLERPAHDAVAAYRRCRARSESHVVTGLIAEKLPELNSSEGSLRQKVDELRALLGRACAEAR
ncbi:MAG TPA: hypothetical protein VM598_07630 [Bdellovibrionota bacterium]|nr:hypothetical protein [Bdellovibrionota bacterium]